MLESQSIKVGVRVRPFLARERDEVSVLTVQGSTITAEAVKEQPKDFAFDYAFWSANPNDNHFASQETVFNAIGKQICENAIAGFNGCVFAYGQTGAGKSYTIVGHGDEPGLIPRITSALVDGQDHNIWVSFFEIYQDHIRDLLAACDAECLTVCEHPHCGVYIAHLTESPIESFQDVQKLLDFGNKKRVSGSTLMNSTSSRSHAIFSIRVETTRNRVSYTSKINLVDLAGSDIVHAGMEAGRDVAINGALSHLCHVIHALADHSRERSTSGKTRADISEHIPFRSSILTFFLKDNLLDNSKTFMIANVSPAAQARNDTLSTLRIAQSVQKINTKARVNVERKEALIKSLQRECDQLRPHLTGPAREELVREVRKEMRERERLVEHLQKTYKEQLETEKQRRQLRDTALHNVGLTAQEIEVMFGAERDTPFLHNVSDDPLLSGCLIYFIRDQATIGSDPSNMIVVTGLDVQAFHGVVTNVKNTKITFIPCEGATTLINGEFARGARILHDHDRLILGRALALRLLVPLAANAKMEASPLELNDVLLEVHPRTSPSYTAFENYIDEMRMRVSKDKMDGCVKLLHQICPMVDTANLMAKELHPEIRLTYELESTWDIYTWEGKDFFVVRGKLNGSVDFFWGVKTFLERYEQMEQLYQTTKRISPLMDPFIELRIFDVKRALEQQKHERRCAINATHSHHMLEVLPSIFGGPYAPLLTSDVPKRESQSEVIPGNIKKVLRPPSKIPEVKRISRKLPAAANEQFSTQSSLEELTRLTLEIKQKLDKTMDSTPKQKVDAHVVKLKAKIIDLENHLRVKTEELESLRQCGSSQPSQLQSQAQFANPPVVSHQPYPSDTGGRMRSGDMGSRSTTSLSNQIAPHTVVVRPPLPRPGFGAGGLLWGNPGFTYSPGFHGSASQAGLSNSFSRSPAVPGTGPHVSGSSHVGPPSSGSFGPLGPYPDVEPKISENPYQHQLLKRRSDSFPARSFPTFSVPAPSASPALIGQ